jgi:integrase
MSEWFNLVAALPHHTASTNTQRAYYRWIDRYLTDAGRLKPLAGDARLARMSKLPMATLSRIVQARPFEKWLQTLVQAGQGRQGLDQARAAIVTLGELLAQAHLLDTEVAAAVRAIPVPAIPRQPAPERLLSSDEIKRLMTAARSMAQSESQMLRNQVVVTLLCSLALRREELSAVCWGDMTVLNAKPVLRVEGDSIELPRHIITLLDRWRAAVKRDSSEPTAQSPLVRRIWKGGRIGKQGLSPDGIWLVIRDAAIAAGLDHVAPDDLRRSVVANLRQAGVSVEDISRLLRHRSRIVTERFLAKLPDKSDEA